ncbi:helix-turn-helix domain-containing protein [Nocardia farcinica]|uniref:helix-turn-helix domain-containing protein n=1 Tax=Nocardia farcinica TaxID=37329 RepID=UPI002803C2C0|nr:helix-turn-helix domain-containing protein [Nocardia farcinica]
MPEQAIYDIPTVCNRLSISRSSVYELIAAGRLKSVKVGKRRMVTSRQLTEFITQLEEAVA